MEKLKNITIIFSLAVSLLSSVAPAKTTSVLLQEGLYAEEIEGDLDTAIKIYEQVISKSKETQRAAAQATYRIGMCYLKKGEKAKAAIHFSNLVSHFPEQKSIVDKARKQLAKLRPPPRVFEPQALDEQLKSGKVPSFKTQIYDNTGIDLDTGVSVPFMDEWPALCDAAWDNDEGGALMIKPKSSVRFIALGAAEEWEDAILTARNSLGVLRTSSSKGMFASQSKFAAVLTSEGNLAVIQIGEHDADKGTIYVWIEKIPAWFRGFGPVMERVINDDGEEKNWLIDFDTGRLFSHTTEITSEEKFLKWAAENRIDAMGETRTSGPGLYGFDMTVIPIAAGTWETISPKGLGEDLIGAKGGTPAVMSAIGNFPVTYIFKTREGGMGVVQILEMQHNKKPRHFRIRYKMLQKETQNTAIANALSVAEAFLSAAISGRDSEAIKLVKPGSAVVEQIKHFQEIDEKDKLKVVSVYGDEEAALAITTEVRAGPDDKGQISIRLIKQRGNWMVEDVDLEIPASLKTEIHSFLQKYPDATKLQEDQFRYKTLQKEQAKSPIDLSTPEATIRSFVKSVYDGNLEAAKACVSKDGHDYDEFMEMLATESNHPFQAMIKAMDASIPVEITSKSIKDGKCKLSWYFTLGRVYYFGETKMKKGTHQEFSSYLELVGDKWLIRDI